MTNPETASGSAVVLRLASMKVWATGAPTWGFTPLAWISAALMLRLVVLARSRTMVTAEGRLNCESVVGVCVVSAE